MASDVLTFAEKGPGVRVDLNQLVRSRLLVEANSGGGKSHALRQLLEQTHGRVQQLVLDPEGEFASLRERYDYILAAPKGGDVAVAVKTGALLCRRLVELGASAVIDLFDLPKPERRRFVRVFLTELMALPRSLWRPLVVVVDEAHDLAPEKGHGESEAAQAVIDLCSQGRKRGFCAVLATQRIGKLSKDAAAELANKLIGRTTLDIDVRRAGDDLGFDKHGREALKTLQPGQFYAVGPAISPTVRLIRSGDVLTSHPQAGEVTAAPPPPPAKVRALLEQLRDLPKEAEEEAKTVDDMRRQLRELRAELTRAKASTPAPKVETVEKPIAIRAELELLAKAMEQMRHLGDQLAQKQQVVVGALDNARILLAPLLRPEPAPRAAPAPRPAAPRPAPARPAPADADGNLSRGERAVLTAIAQHEGGVTKEQLSVLTGYKRSSRDTYLQKLFARGLVSGGQSIIATAEGVAALGSNFEPLPTGAALLEHWRQRLPNGERVILDALVSVYPDAMDKNALGAHTQYKRSSRDTYLQKLRARQLITEPTSGEARASDLLFDGGVR
jgi:uncharacterized protein